MHWQTALSQAELVEHETETVNDSLESLDSAVDIEAIEAAIADVKKAFLLGQRADAFDSEYTNGNNDQWVGRDCIHLQTIDSTTAELRDALSTYASDAQSASTSVGKASYSREETEDSEDDETAESAESSTDGDAEEDSLDAENQEQLEVSDRSGDS